MERTYLRRICVTLASATSLCVFACCWILLAGCNRPATSQTETGTSAPPRALPSDEELRTMLDRAIDTAYLTRRLNLRDHAAWQIVHAILAYEADFLIEDRDGKLVPALDYLLNGGEMTGWVLRAGDSLDGEGSRGLLAVLDAGSTTGQGHADQWLGYLADCNLKIDQVIKVGGQDFTLADMLRQAERDVPNNELREYSWTLMALTAYYPTDHTWTAKDGSPWSTSRLMEIEVEHDLAGSACGGTHRMCGIVMALNRHKDQQRPLEGPWQAADEKVRRCVMLAKEFQNDDGSLSTNFFTSKGQSLEIKSCLHATGHTFEFVVSAVDDEQVKAEWIRRAAVYLCEFLDSTQDVDLECGALYHAVRGLMLYRQRLFGDHQLPREKLLSQN